MDCTTNEAEVPQIPAVRVGPERRHELDSIRDRIEDLTDESLTRLSLRQANRLMLAYFLILDILNDQDQKSLRISPFGKRMLRHVDAIYCALAYEQNSYDGDMGEMWCPLRGDVRRFLAHLYARLSAK